MPFRFRMVVVVVATIWWWMLVKLLMVVGKMVFLVVEVDVAVLVEVDGGVAF